MRVAILGAPGAGKTTLAADVVATLREEGLPAEFVSEFAREFIVANGGINNAYEQAFMAREQKRREQILGSRSDLIVISDSPYLLNIIYSARLASSGNNPLRSKSSDVVSQAMILELIYKEFLEALKEYDVIVFCRRPTAILNHEDGIRIHNETESIRLEKQIYGFMQMHNALDMELSETQDRKSRAESLVQYIKTRRSL